MAALRGKATRSSRKKTIESSRRLLNTCQHGIALRGEYGGKEEHT